MIASLVAAGLVVALLPTLGVPLVSLTSATYGVGLASAQWVLTITLLVAAVATPTLGRLGDGPRRRRALLGALGLVVVGSVVGATAQSFPQMLVGRALQGVGYGIVPLCMALVQHHITGRRRVVSVSLLSLVVPVGVGLGWSLTGIIVDALGFRSAFWFAVLVSAAALVAVGMTVPGAQPRESRRPFDVGGAALLAGGLVAVLLALSYADVWGWTSVRVTVVGSLGIGLLVVWSVVQLRVESPLVDLRGLSVAPVLAANAAALLLSMSMFMGMILISLLAQTPVSAGYGFGATLTETGLLLLPMAAGTAIAQPMAVRAVGRVGCEVVVAVGAVGLAVSFLAIALFHERELPVLGATALIGLSVGASFGSIPTMILDHVGGGRAGSAMSVNQVLRNIGGALGSALAATILSLSFEPGRRIPAEWGYAVALGVAASVSLLAAAIVLLVMGRSRRRPPVEACPREPDVVGPRRGQLGRSEESLRRYPPARNCSVISAK